MPWAGLKCWPLTISFQAMRAILLASATAASLGGLRFSSSTSHGEGWPPVPCQGQALPRRTCWITAVAPTTSTLRKASSPARVMPPSAGRRVILWCQPDPGREMPAGLEGFGLGDFHDQQGGADRPDAGDLHQTPARFVLPVPGHQLGVDR